MRFNPEKQISTEKAFTESLVKLGGKYKNFVILSANVAAPLGLATFDKEHPDRHFPFGNSLRAMIAAASGFVVRGKIPFLCGYGISVTGRGWDSIRNYLSATPLNVKIVGIHTGILNSQEGATHQPLEDISLMRSIPGMKVVCPADAEEAKKAVEMMMLDYGPTYLRLMHLPLPNLYDKEHKFVFGKGNIYKSGTDVCIFAIGTTMHTALDAAEILERKGKSVMVVNMSSIAPFDEDLVVECAKAVNHVVTVEDHQIIGGLGSAVCETLATHYPMKVLRLGMDGFAESGKVDDVYRKYGLDGVGIAEKIESATK
ncbi:transketolase family protein [Candidatus Peregrinibacteria bacterium]|nr:transketolase family protein [Candidatus Peregrinibacteria bacterium]